MSLRKAKLHTNNVVPHHQNQFLVSISISSREASSQSTRGMLWGREFYTHTPQLGEGTRHILDKMLQWCYVWRDVLNQQRALSCWLRMNPRPALDTWIKRVESQPSTTSYSWSCISRECRTRAACDHQGGSSPAAALSPPVPWLTGAQPPPHGRAGIASFGAKSVFWALCCLSWKCQIPFRASGVTEPKPGLANLA